MTGALSPVITDSSTVAMPSITSPSPGIMSPVSQSRYRRSAASRPGLFRCLPFDSTRLAIGIGLGLAQRIGLRFAARFGHGFGEVREQHGEPEPDAKSESRSRDVRAVREQIAEQEERGERRATSTTKITGFFASVSGFSLTKRIVGGARGRSPDRRAAATGQLARQQRTGVSQQAPRTTWCGCFESMAGIC